MPNRAQLPPQLLIGSFTRAQAVAQGVSRSRLRGRDLVRPHHGLYSAAPASDLDARCRTLEPYLDERRLFSHLTAARLFGMPLPRPAASDEPLHLLVLADSAPIRRPGVIGWETEDVAVSRGLLRGLPVVAPAVVWTQLAVPGATGTDPNTGRKWSLSPEWLVAVGDFLLTGPMRHGTRHPLCSAEELAAAVAQRRGRRGVVAAKWALERVRWPVHSPRETHLRLGLVHYGLPEPQVQVPVFTSRGWRHGDLGYPEARLILEYQGDHHRTDRQQWLTDLTRIQLFEDAGWRVIHVGDDDVNPDCAALARRVRRALAAALRPGETS